MKKLIFLISISKRCI